MSDKVLQIAIIGDPFVGKSSLIRSHFGDVFSDVHIAALLESEVCDIKISNKVHKIKLIDTMRNSNIDYSLVDLIILCYSIENRISYRNIKNKWIEELKKLPNWPIPFVLVATKVDLRQEFPNVFFITTDDGENLSKEIEASKYFEVSAKDNINIKQLIEHSVKIFYPEEQKVEEKITILHQAASNGNQQNVETINQKNSSCCCC
ncbi:ras-like GTP-binding protein RhoL [Chironomus tepperi]|uniref:ras-like GTP-binding protein RhoL n=1 Tax=Chironomus tepperi TaxID=113505 RepID=UPI00391F437A